MTGWSFLRNSLGEPGGFVVYIAGFLSQGYYHSWLGALVIVLTALCLGELSRRHFVVAGHPHSTVLTCFPLLMIFLLYSRYKHPLSACLVVSLGLYFSLVFEKLPLRKTSIRIVAYCLLVAVGFWLMGAGGVLVFLLMTVIYGIFVHRNWGLTILAVPASVVITWGLAQYLFVLPPQEALLSLTPFSPTLTLGMKTFLRVLIFLLYGFVPFTVSLMFFGNIVFGKHKQTRKVRLKTKKAEKTHAVAGQKKISLKSFRKPAVIALPIVLMGMGLYFSYDQMSKAFVLSNTYSRQKQWNKVIELSHNLPKGISNPYFNHDIIRALYHTGRLPYDLFHFPQTPQALLLTHEKKESYLTQLKLCDIFMELGQVNMAEKEASELLAVKGPSGIALEKLAWINILKRQTDTARIYLNAMKKDMVFRNTADALLSSLNNGFAPYQTDYIDKIRSYMHEEEYSITGKESISEILLGLLEQNPRNRMAFEYLMACYLLTGRADKVVENIERLNDLGYKGIPTLYEEAILIYFGVQGQQVNLNKFNIRRETIQRYMKFVQLRKDMQTANRQAVLYRLIQEFGSTYFFYFSFGRVGLT
jgi:MFS family permease